MTEDSKFLLDKIISVHNETSSKLARNILLQGLILLMATSLLYSIEDAKIVLLKFFPTDNSQLILLVIPFYLTYLFVEFGYLLSLYITCGYSKKPLVNKLLSDSKQELNLSEIDIEITKTTFKSFNFFEPMSDPFKNKLAYSFLNYVPTGFSILIVGLNHFYTLHATRTLIKNDMLFILFALFFLAIVIPFYLHFKKEHKDKQSISPLIPILGIVISGFEVLYFLFRTFVI